VISGGSDASRPAAGCSCRTPSAKEQSHQIRTVRITAVLDLLLVPVWAVTGQPAHDRAKVGIGTVLE
jgi:hypothetical protein